MCVCFNRDFPMGGFFFFFLTIIGLVRIVTRGRDYSLFDALVIDIFYHLHLSVYGLPIAWTLYSSLGLKGRNWMQIQFDPLSQYRPIRNFVFTLTWDVLFLIYNCSYSEIKTNVKSFDNWGKQTVGCGLGWGASIWNLKAPCTI